MLFDRFVFVDWSASSKPKRGRDSIWVCEGTHERVATPRNPRTRVAAEEDVRACLRDAAANGERVLCGFDFPYGYPAGLAAAVGFGGPDAPWRRLWRLLADEVSDTDSNRNNRFEVASDLNSRLGSSNGPFWGCPGSKATDALTTAKGAFPCLSARGELQEFRATERRLHAARKWCKSVWQLSYAGCVGSQAIMGIPRLARLRSDPELAKHSLVWPFETGFRLPPSRQPLVLHAEIWPGVATLDLEALQPKDAAQVHGLVDWARKADRRGELRTLIEIDQLNAAEVERCVQEEGWILGAG